MEESYDNPKLENAVVNYRGAAILGGVSGIVGATIGALVFSKHRLLGGILGFILAGGIVTVYKIKQKGVVIHA